MNKWLGRPPRTRAEIEGMRFCCESDVQCGYCPFQERNAARSIQDLARQALAAPAPGDTKRNK